jgi:hypothetical protein
MFLNGSGVPPVPRTTTFRARRHPRRHIFRVIYDVLRSLRDHNSSATEDSPLLREITGAVPYPHEQVTASAIPRILIIVKLQTKPIINLRAMIFSY